MTWRNAAWFLATLAAGMAFHAPGIAETPASSDPAQSEGMILDSESPAVHKHAAEWGWTSGGAADFPGGGRGGAFWALQLRWGRVLTAAHGPGLLRGTLEYAFEIVPAMVLRQSGAVFGGGFNPLVLQYDFTSRHRLIPFIQAGGGMLFTTREFPQGTSQVNFTPQGGFGAYWFRSSRTAVVFGVRFHHISNAGLSKPNTGYNALYIYTGLSWWR